MKHITKETEKKIRTAASAVAELETGCRNQREAEEDFTIAQVRRFAKDVKKLPKEYKILYTRNENLGTKKWPHMVTTVEYATVERATTVRETEASYILETKYTETRTHKEIISKAKIIAFVF